MIEVDVVIPNYSQAQKVLDCVDSLFDFNDNVGKIVVVNDAGPEDVREFLRNELPKRGVEFLVNKENKGFSFTCNQGFRATNSEVVLCLNDDTFSKQDFISPALRDFEDLRVGVVGSLTLYPNGKVEHAGIVHNEKHPLFFDNVHRMAFPFHRDVRRRREVWAVTGACMFIRRSLFSEVGFFDEDFELGFEDLDFCLRVGEAGYKILYEPRSKLYHYGGETRGVTPDSSREKRSQRVFWEKWYKKISGNSEIIKSDVVIPKSWDT